VATLLHGLRVKIRSSFWTSDGGAYGRRNLLRGVASRDIARFIGSAGLLLVTASPVVMYRSLGHGGCLPLATTSALLLVSEGLFSAVDFDRLQRSAAAENAWHSPVRCGTASKDGACGTYNQKRLGM
jgi:hypothetical protein